MIELDPNMPNDNHEARIYLKAKKVAYLEIIEDMETHNLKKGYEVNGLLWNKIEEIDGVLE